LSGDEKQGCHLAFLGIVCQKQNVQQIFHFLNAEENNTFFGQNMCKGSNFYEIINLNLFLFTIF
jgi:hypothetical protein